MKNKLMDQLINNLYQRVPVGQIELPSEIDEGLLLATITTISEVNPYYIKSFLSSKLFKDPTIDHDEFYELFSTLLSSKPKDVMDTDLITYNINGTLVNLNETPRLISGSGTTGLRTWEAALYLSHFLATDYQHKLQDQRIIELGSGTGLVGLTLVKDPQIHFKNLLITDGDSTPIETLSSNFLSNGIQLSDLPNVQCQSLWWGKDEVPSDIDIAVAADVTYDSSVVPFLVLCISQLLQKGAKEALIAATIRNEDTIETFEKSIVDSEMTFEVISSAKNPCDLKQTLWYPRTSPEIRVYKITAHSSI